MALSEPPTNTDPMDLLRRFIPTPFKAVYEIDTIRVTVQSNDLTLMPPLRLTEREGVSQQPTLDWKLIRDEYSGAVLDPPRTFISGPVAFVEMGSACFFGLDRKRGEILGFIGTRIDARTYQDFVVPLLCRMTREACGFGSGDASKALGSGIEAAND